MKRIFISYAHEDAAFRDAFVTHLQVLQDAGVMESWHDGEIQPGADWKASVDDQLRRADIVVLLVSAHFLASKSCQELELAPALGRWEQNLVTVMPIIVRSCAWDLSPVGRLQALPTNGKPIATWSHPDDAWTEVIKRIREVLTGQLSSTSSSQPQPFPTFATLHSRSGGLVQPLIWQLRATPSNELDLTKAEVHEALEDSVVSYTLPRDYQRTTRWPLAFVMAEQSSARGDAHLWVRTYKTNVSNIVGDEQILAEPNGVVTFQRATFYDGDGGSLDFGKFSHDALQFLRFLGRYSGRLSLRSEISLAALVWTPDIAKGASAMFFETPVDAEQSDRIARLPKRFVSGATRVRPGSLVRRADLLTACKRLVDRVANEFVHDPLPYRHNAPGFLAISLDSLHRLWDALSIPDPQVPGSQGA